jgi:hypothetical protein
MAELVIYGHFKIGLKITFRKTNEQKLALLPEMPLHEFAGNLADGPAVLPFFCPAPLVA